MNTRSSLSLAATLLLTAACGSTVPAGVVSDSVGSSLSAAGGTDVGSPGGLSGMSTTGAAGAGTGGTAAAGGLGPASGSTGASAAPGAAGLPGTAGPGAPVGGAVDHTPIRLGALYLSGGNAALGAGFAATPVNFGDGQLEAKAVVADINSHGGVGGRPIDLYLQAIQATDANKPTAFDAACAALADDHHVFAIISMFNIRSPLASCAAKHKVLLLDAALGAGDDTLYQQFHDWAFTPAQMSLDVEQALVIRHALATGVITAQTRVGIVVQNDDDIFPRVLAHTIEPTLKAHGVPYDAEVISNATDSSGISSAILKFAQNGVKVVMFSAGNGGVPEVVFMQAAEQQQYRPDHYALGDSTDTWFVGDSAPAAQAQRITGVGSYPIGNVNADQVPSTPGEKHCLQVITQAGESLKDRHSSLTATFYCELFYGFTAAGAKVVGKMTADGWRAAYRSLGTAYPTMMTFAADVGASPNSGARSYRDLAWSTSCSCVTYSSPLQRL